MTVGEGQGRGRVGPLRHALERSHLPEAIRGGQRPSERAQWGVGHRPSVRGEVGLAVSSTAAPCGFRDRVPAELGGAGRGRSDRGDLVEVDEGGVVVRLRDECPDQRRPEDVDRPGRHRPQPARDPDRGARVHPEGQPHRERRRLPLDLPRDGAPVGVALAGQLAGDLDRVDDVERVVGAQEQRRRNRRRSADGTIFGGTISGGGPSRRSRTR